VPAFNEEASIAEVVVDLRALSGVDVVVIDDGSTDETADRALAAGARVVSLPFNVGIGGAVQTGYLVALEDGYEVAVQVDGDGQHPARELPRLTAALAGEDADLVVGSRFLAPTPYRAPLPRRVGIRFFARIVSRLLGVRITDTTSGFRAAGPRAIRLFAEAYPHDYPEVEAVVVAARAGLCVVEVPVTMRERQGGRSSITPVRSAYYIVKVLLAVLMEMLRKPSSAMKEV
jgi:glycosyltransferase involved in cell wall biosynthesis